MSTTPEEAKRIQKERADEANKAMGLTAHGEYRSSSNKASPAASSGPAKKWAKVETLKKVGLGRRRKSRKAKKTRRHRK